jgi:hypothetical protein
VLHGRRAGMVSKLGYPRDSGIVGRRHAVLRMPLGYGVIGSPTGSGPVSLGSSPSTPASRRPRSIGYRLLRSMAPLCSGLARRPLKAVARVRIPSGLPSLILPAVRRNVTARCDTCRLTSRASGFLAGCRYSAEPAMLTIQGTPNWSMHMPNSSPHICFSSGMVTVPELDNCCQ